MSNSSQITSVVLKSVLQQPTKEQGVEVFSSALDGAKVVGVCEYIVGELSPLLKSWNIAANNMRRFMKLTDDLRLYNERLKEHPLFVELAEELDAILERAESLRYSLPELEPGGYIGSDGFTN